MAKYQVLFELRSGEGNYENIVITNEDGLAMGDERAYIRITKPGGTIIKEMDLETPDIDLDGGPTEYTIAIPKTTGGDYLSGTYLVEIAEDQPGDPGVYYEETYEFYWSPLELAATVGFSVNCVCGKITVTDSTSYGTATIISRTMTIYPPQIPGQASPTPTSSSEATIIVSFGYANVKYQTILEVEVQREIITSVLSMEEFTKTQWNDVVCDYNFCALLECVQDEYTRIQALASSRGGINKIPAYELEVWLKLTKDFQLHNAYITCGDYASAQEMYDTILDDLNCDCNCGSSGSTEPVAISAACGGEEGDTLVLDNTFPVVVALDGGVWMVSLDADWLATVNALTGHVHESDNDFLTIGQAYDGLTNITTWTHGIDQGDWNYFAAEDFDANLQDYVENVGAYRLENATDNIIVTAKIKSANEVELGGAFNLWSSALPLAYRPTSDSPFFPVTTEEGVVIGQVQLLTDGTVTFYPAVDYFTTPVLFTFQIVWNKNISLDW